LGEFVKRQNKKSDHTECGCDYCSFRKFTKKKSLLQTWMLF